MNDIKQALKETNTRDMIAMVIFTPLILSLTYLAFIAIGDVFG